MPRFADLTRVHPIRVDGTLAVLVLEPPAHTPEGVSVGTSVTAVHRTYPGAAELKPTQPYAYGGILATDGDLGYLFLHNGGTVQRGPGGYTTYPPQLFESRFPPR